MAIKLSFLTSIIVWVFRIVFTLCVFFIGMRLGKLKSLNERKPCPIVYPEKVEILQLEVGTDLSSLPRCKDQKIYDHCSTRPDNDQTFMHLEYGSIAESMFGYLHHPSSPTKWSFVITQEQDWPDKNSLNNKCQEVYMTRTGSRSSQPNKCVAVAKVPEGVASIVHNGNRVGFTALLTDQYQNDYTRPSSQKEELVQMPPLLNQLSDLIAEFKQKMGDPINSDGTRKTAIVMVANEGVMDLLLNFICSAEGAQIDLSTIMVFVGSQEYVKVIEGMGGNAMYRCQLFFIAYL